MPSPAHPSKTTTRGGGTKLSPTKQKALDIGTPLGVHDTNTVREKIRKWQQQGGGVVIAKDACGPDDEENPAPPKPKSTPKQEEKKTQSPSAARNRSHSTPKKRVVSDEHWRRQRNAAKAKTTLPKQASPQRISVYTTNDELRTPREEKKRDVQRQERPKSSQAVHHGTSVTPSRREHTKVKLPRRPKSVADIIVVEEDSDESAADHDRSLPTRRPTSAKVSRSKDMSEVTDKMRRRTPPPDEDLPWAKSEADFSELSRRRARGPDPKPRPLTKLPKGGIFGQMLDESKKIFSKPEPPKSVPNRGAKIEAWLTNAFDPFLDDGQPPVEVPAPLKTRPRRTPDSQTQEAESKPVTDRPGRGEDYRQHEARKTPPKVERARVKEMTIPKANETSTPMSQSSPRTEKAHSRSKSTPTAVNQDMSKGSVNDEKLDDSDTETHPFSDGSEVSGNNAPVPIGRRRPFPSTGLHRLSTIASVETFSTHRDLRAVPSATSKPAPVKDVKASTAETTAQSQVKPAMEPASEPTKRLATHDDLISILSLPNTRTKSTRSARSIRTNKSRLAPVSVDEVMHELSADEAKYMRELQTLVGGVIPVLLTCVLSRSESAIAAGLFRPAVDSRDDVNFTKPIVDMGVASERLKALHKRIPQTDLDALLTWALGAQRVYREYLRAWRLGFKDVVVNLAPSEEADSANNADTKSLDEGMARDANGDIVDSDGEKVDVAYLLKRPLVRLKYLAKTFRGVNALRPSSKAEEIAAAFGNLVIEARRRAREERARLEDESAACIDSTRARDPKTLGVLTGVTVDSTRRVRARDFFNLSLYHSSGQIMDCRAELLLRDNPPGSEPGGDLLICEIDHAARWLLFPPIDTSCVSARKGSVKGEIVIMLRSSDAAKDKLQELLSLQIDEEEVGIEWVQLLGTDPIPPAISRSQTFMSRSKAESGRSDTDDARALVRRGPPSPSAINIPIGEQADGRRGARRSVILKESSSESSTLDSSSTVDSRMSQLSAITRESDYAEESAESPKRNSRASLPSSRHFESSESKSPTTLKRAKAKRISRHGDASPSGSSSPKGSASVVDTPTTPDTPRRDQKRAGTRFYESAGSPNEKLPPQEHFISRPAISDAIRGQPQRISSVPSMDLPTIRKIRRGSGQSHVSGSSDISPVVDNKQYVNDQPTMDDAAPAPPPPLHRSPPPQPKLGNVVVLEPSTARQKRRASSPLKHEYEPSTASDTYTDSDASTVRQNEYGSSSESSAEDSDDEVASIADSVDIIDHIRSTVQASVLITAASTLSPSNSASQKGYRTVPSQPSKATKAIASIFAWSDKGSWESLHIDECSILVSPGLIEAYEMSSIHSDPNDDYGNEPDRPQPLIALELTPLVPIRRGTAIDISIRSPPTERSKITSSGNVMFRSRNSDECEGLYRLINQARINNPTYIALQNARGPFADMPMNLERSNKTSWLGWPKRRRSYRASANAPRSLAEASDSSVGTMSSAFSALKRFSGSKMFNTSRSTDTSQKGGSGSLHSSSAASGSRHSPFTSRGIERIAAAMKGADGIGLSNAKIRLYVRETQSKWRDMGAARLTIMPVDRERERERELERERDSPRPKTAASSQSDASESGSASASSDADRAPAPAPAPRGEADQQQQSSPPTSGSSSPRREPHPSTLANPENAKKRILIRGKTRGEVLLDVCLGESSFERVARTGIAASVWEENEGGAVANKGGVVGGSFSVYMIQMKSEAEAAYTFGLVGKLRY